MFIDGVKSFHWHLRRDESSINKLVIPELEFLEWMCRSDRHNIGITWDQKTVA